MLIDGLEEGLAAVVLVITDIVVMDSGRPYSSSSVNATAFLFLLTRNGTTKFVVPITPSLSGFSPGFPVGMSGPGRQGLADVDFVVGGALEPVGVRTDMHILHVSLETGLAGVLWMSLGPCPAGR